MWKRMASWARQKLKSSSHLRLLNKSQRLSSYVEKWNHRLTKFKRVICSPYQIEKIASLLLQIKSKNVFWFLKQHDTEELKTDSSLTDLTSIKSSSSSSSSSSELMFERDISGGTNRAELISVQENDHSVSDTIDVILERKATSSTSEAISIEGRTNEK